MPPEPSMSPSLWRNNSDVNDNREYGLTFLLEIIIVRQLGG